VQARYTVENLPDAPIAASAAFFADHLAAAEALLEEEGMQALVIVLPPAETAHDDWRRALARDLARRWTPKRVNVLAAAPGQAREAMLAYLGNAPGVTGQYLVAHE